MAAALGVAIAVNSARDLEPGAPHQPITLKGNGVLLRGVRAGRGPAVVLLHGYGESLIAWRGVFDRLAASFDVTAFDLRGFGLSGKPYSGYTTETMARDALAVLDDLGVGRAVLVGHSLGGTVAAAAALIAPQRVRALVLLAPAIAPPHGVLAETGEPDGPALWMRNAVARYEALRTRFSPPHEPAWLAESPSAVRYIPGDDPEYLRALSAVLREFNFGYVDSTRRRQLEMPVLLVWGRFDPLFPVRIGRRLVSELPSGRLVEIPRSWHRPHVERPDTIATVIAQFVASLPLDPVPGPK